MCFEVPALVLPANSSKSGATVDDVNDDELSLMDLDGNDIKPSTNSAELGALNESLQELLDGIQVAVKHDIELACNKKIDRSRWVRW